VEAGSDTTWTTVYIKDTINTTGWEFVEVDLSSLSLTAPVQFRFVTDEVSGSSKDDIAIDDIVFDVIGDVEFVNDLAGLNHYPNPVGNELVINSNRTVVAVEIYDMLGRLVLTTNPNALDMTIDTRALEAGSYMVKVNRGESIGTFKMMKK
jgi:hypothetical protein